MTSGEHIDRAEAFHRVSDVLRCKWTLAVLDALGSGTSRPSQIERALPGLTSKVLNDRLRKLERFGLVTREAFAEVPPRVEYTPTPRGQELAALARTIGSFVDDWAQGGEARERPAQPR
ncbi:MAG: HxlR family transcriptional regulator [Phycisphaeraceae bacterium]|nr:MAG: HxlR family transcriptional regulator [Phycisphaeraceae bacterium]